MTKTILYSENNKFSVNLFKNEKIEKKLNIECVIATKNDIELLKNTFKDARIISIENFAISNIEFIKHQKENLLDANNSETFSQIESECIKLLDFVNPGQNKFSLIEARLIFSESLVFILDFIYYYKPELIIFTNVPHSFQSYLFYKVCEIKKIKIIFKRELSLPQNYIFQNSIKKPLINFNNNEKKQNTKIRKKLSNYIKAILNNDKKKINKIFSRLRNHKMIHNQYYFNSFIIFFILRTIHITPLIILKLLRDIAISFKLKNKQFLMLEDYIKDKNKNLNNSRTSKLKMNVEFFLGDLRKFKLLQYYKRKQNKIEFNQKYIYFPLHYQPEATTYPFGGIFIDQIRAIKLLAAYFTNYKIVVKEHPDTFNISHLAWTKGDYTRNENFYDQISSIKDVIFVDLKKNSLDLIKGASAVATVAGAVGLESLLMGKHTLIFGHPWYEEFEEVFKFDKHDEISSNLDKYIKKKISIKKTIKDINLSSRNIFEWSEAMSQSEIKKLETLFLERIE
ncbi:hypothetical protein N8012_01365 [Pelagibacteraceae bacterium]|nr:hypothetical protein [Pelagibacteraceae bacterium]